MQFGARSLTWELPIRSMWVLFPASLWTQGSIISKRLSCSLLLRLHDPLQAFFKSDLDLTLRPSSYVSCPCLRRMVVTLPAPSWSVVAGTRGKADVHSSVRRPYQSADWLGSRRELRTKTWLQLPTSAIASEYRVDSLGRSCRLSWRGETSGEHIYSIHQSWKTERSTGKRVRETGDSMLGTSRRTMQRKYPSCFLSQQLFFLQKPTRHVSSGRWNCLHIWLASNPETNNSCGLTLNFSSCFQREKMYNILLKSLDTFSFHQFCPTKRWKC